MYEYKSSSAGLKKGLVPMSFITFFNAKVSFNYPYFKMNCVQAKTTYKNLCSYTSESKTIVLFSVWLTFCEIKCCLLQLTLTSASETLERITATAAVQAVTIWVTIASTKNFNI